jgi:hypothetical protein
VNFPFICSNIPAAPAYEYTSLRWHDFPGRGLLLSRKLLNQEFLLVKLKSLLR